MSASGVKLFDDDNAADIREIFREYLARGRTFSDATAAILKEFNDLIGTEEESVLWLALAVMHWQFGVHDTTVRNQALRVIEDGSDLRRWDFDPQFRKAREETLQKLRNQLSEPNPRLKKVRLKRRIPPKCPWQTGDVFAYRLNSGQFLLLRVVAVRHDQFDDQPLCELLDWVGRELPDEQHIAALRIRRNKRYPSESVIAFPMQKKHLVRCTSTGVTCPPEMQDDGSYLPPIDFNNLPATLEEYFGLSIESDTQPGSGR